MIRLIVPCLKEQDWYFILLNWGPKPLINRLCGRFLAKSVKGVVGQPSFMTVMVDELAHFGSLMQ
jgi:hypothetical protein